MADQPMSLPEVARRLGTTRSRVQRLFERGVLPQPPRVGTARLVYESQLGEIADALARNGYPVNRPAEAVA